MIMKHQKLNEKLIVYNNRKPYGQVVFVTGGSGGGKGFAIQNFIDSASYKVMDVDELKKKVLWYARIEKIDLDKLYRNKGYILSEKGDVAWRKLRERYPDVDIANMDLRIAHHVEMLHYICEMLEWNSKILAGLINDKKILPNIIFDVTGANRSRLVELVQDLKKIGYKSNNMHLTWILTNYKIAYINNKTRDRIVPADILLATHLGAAETMYDLVFDQSNIGIGGRIDVILNNPNNTIFYVDKNTKQKLGVVKDFVYLPLKKEGGAFFPEKLWKEKLFREIFNNTPIMKNLIELLKEFE